MAGNLRGCAETTQVVPSGRISSLIFVNENVVDDDVDGDGFQADMVAQGGDDVLLDVPGYFVYGVSVGDRHGEVDDCGAAQDAHGGVGMTVLEGGPLGGAGDCAAGAAAKGDADAGDHAGAVAGQGGHDPGGDADDPSSVVCRVYHTSRISTRIWLMTAAVRPGELAPEWRPFQLLVPIGR